MDRISQTSPSARRRAGRAPWLATACVSLAGAAALTLAGLWALAPANAADKNDPPKNPDPPAQARSPQALPITQVVLYSSGVGYFLREGSVDGDARIDLSFQAG